MSDLNLDVIRRYLETLVRGPVEGIRVTPLGDLGAASLKGYGYGVPLRIDFRADGRERSAVLETMAPSHFGHEHMADRGQALLWDHDTYNRLPGHVRSLDVGAFRRDGGMVSLGDVEELFLLAEFAEGQGYFEDLARLRDTRELTALDVARADALCDWLAGIHRAAHDDPPLYARRIRELVGHGECIMGLVDSYPPRFEFIDAHLLQRLEHRCVEWRWRLKGRAHRLRQVHGDFHPWNVLFRKGTDFTVLDRARGEWGEPADDVTSMTMNYLFFSLQRGGCLDGNLETLYLRFWERYLERTGDREILEVAAPFFAFRGLVMASPLWYPRLPTGVRRALLNFVSHVLDAPSFEPARTNAWCR